MDLFLTYYGDDFTGSTAAMEALSFAGVPTLLFLNEPDMDLLAEFPDLKAVGVAGLARSKDPEWMRASLPPVFDEMKKLDAPLVHYKVCSTFDSSPQIGSIGTAAEIGWSIFGGEWIPLVVGDPLVRRYQIFGQLFAGADDDVYRLDRHPVMSRHPVTPMHEADLGAHLSLQTELPVGVIDMVAMKSGQSGQTIEKRICEGAKILAIDILDDETIAEAGRLIWQDGQSQPFVIGSQGVENALAAHWKNTGLISPKYEPPELTPVDQIFAISGSCAPTTADQIARAEANGFAVVEFEAACAVTQSSLNAETLRVRELCLDHLSHGRDVIAATARGPGDPAVLRMNNAVENADISAGEVNRRLGSALGSLVLDARKQAGIRRAVFAGGDTSGHAMAATGAQALTAVAPLARGAPLCQIHSRSTQDVDGLEVTLKGGQMGAPSFFMDAKGQT